MTIKTQFISTTAAILAINPDAQVTVSTPADGSAETINWGDTVEISKSDIDAKKVELEAEWDAQEYARNRQAEYPTIAELTVALYDTDDKSAVEAKRAAVKAKYPKPE